MIVCPIQPPLSKLLICLFNLLYPPSVAPGSVTLHRSLVQRIMECTYISVMTTRSGFFLMHFNPCSVLFKNKVLENSPTLQGNQQYCLRGLQ